MSLSLALAAPARAEPETYLPAAPGGDSPASVGIDLPYTFGTHHFDVRDVRGQIQVDWQERPLVSGRLTVPIEALRGGGDTLNCHMREALGLDYRRSAFPGSHVCSGGRLPTAGNDAIAFPEIAFDIKSVTVGPAPPSGAPGAGSNQRHVVVMGRFTIHGISRDDRLELDLTSSPAEGAHPRSIRVAGSRRIRLSDYGIQVKRALVITAGEEATVRINLVLTRRQ